MSIVNLANAKMAFFEDTSIFGLDALINDPYSQEVIKSPCRQCGVELECRRIVAPFVACDACIEKAEHQAKTERHQSYWYGLFGDQPSIFDDTDINHPLFPQQAYNSLKLYAGKENLILQGGSGQGKTRLAIVLLKRCLWRHDMFVSILWPEFLKQVKYARDKYELLMKWGKYDLLLLDDSLMTGAADEVITDWLKDLLDYRMRYGRKFILTTQLSGNDYMEAADRYNNMTSSDQKRVEAVLRRLRENAQTVKVSRDTSSLKGSKLPL